jgi:hypothetical protein
VVPVILCLCAVAFWLNAGNPRSSKTEPAIQEEQSRSTNAGIATKKILSSHGNDFNQNEGSETPRKTAEQRWSDPLAWPPLSPQEFVDDKDELFNRLWSDHVADCSAEGREDVREDVFRIDVADAVLPSNPNVQILGVGDGLDLKAGQWHRVWLLPMVGRPLRPQCRAGDVFHVSIESDDSKVAVETILDIGNGLHEVHFFIRRPGRYRLCADLVRSPTVFLHSESIPIDAKPKIRFNITELQCPLRLWNVTTLDALYRRSDRNTSQQLQRLSQLGTAFHSAAYSLPLPPKGLYSHEQPFPFTEKGSPVNLKPYCRPKQNPTTLEGEPIHFHPLKGDYCIGVASTELRFGGAIPTRPRIYCRDLLRRDWRNANKIFRSGAWVRLPNGECDGVHCVGDLPAISPANGEGWFWASDLCTFALFSYPSRQRTPMKFEPKNIFGRQSKPQQSRQQEVPGSEAAKGFPQADSKWIFGGKWLLAWGDSTLKQAVSNFLEYGLKQPIAYVLGQPMYQEEIEAMKQQIRRHPSLGPDAVQELLPDFFDYRQWDSFFPGTAGWPSTTLKVSADNARVGRVSFCWGGCENVTTPSPRACQAIAGKMALKNRRCVEELLTSALAGRVQLAKSRDFPFTIAEVQDRVRRRLLAEADARAANASRMLRARNSSEQNLTASPPNALNSSASERRESSASVTSAAPSRFPPSGANTFAPSEAPSTSPMDSSNASSVGYSSQGHFRAPFPALILLSHFHWRHRRFNESSFLEEVNETLREWLIPLVRRAQAELRLKFKPLIVWHSPTSWTHQANIRGFCDFPPEFQLLRHFVPLVEHFLIENFPEDVVVVGRGTLTAPFRFGDRFGHSGVHYGSSAGVCGTIRRHSEEPIDPIACQRDTIGDDMLPVFWATLLAALGGG